MPDGARYYPGYFDRSGQEALVKAIRAVVAAAPLYRPVMPRSGRPFSVRMTNCGSLGWVADKAGYRYQPRHPVTDALWPEIPPVLLSLWAAVADYPHSPEACLVNVYDESAKMGLHQDKDETALDAPVVSISLGDDCRFRIGGVERGGKTASLRLASGDVFVLGGAARLCHHGVDRIDPQTSTLLTKGGRINLTLRRVTLPDGQPA
nr:alpha-ketoglutarate-dependent dioxygenase AlkB [Jiella flava]